MTWFRTGPSGGLLWKCYQAFELYKTCGISWLTEDLLPSQEGLSYLDTDWIHPHNSLTQYGISMSPSFFLECMTHAARGPICWPVTSANTHQPTPRNVPEEVFVFDENSYIWIKIDQLDVTCFSISVFTAQSVSNVSTSIFRSLRLICWVISWVVLLWFDVLVLRCGSAGVEWYPYTGWSTSASACIRIPHHPSRTTP